MIEIFKFMNGLSPRLVWEFRESRHVTCIVRIKSHPVKTMNFDLDAISFKGSFLWNTIDDSIT